MQLQAENVLQGYSQPEKAAYLSALASLSTADREASDEEMNHLSEMANAAGLSEEYERQVREAGRDTTGATLKKNLDALKSSDLRYSLITDLIALAKVDGTYSEEEKENIQKISRYLQVDQNQFQVLDQFVNKASEEDLTPEKVSKPGFLDSLGMKNQFAGAGFNTNSIGKNLLGMLAPVLLGGLASKAMRGRQSSGGLGGGLGGMLGGMLGGGSGGGLSGMLPGGMGGGLGSLISGMSRSKSNNTMGGMLGRLLR